MTSISSFPPRQPRLRATGCRFPLQLSPEIFTFGHKPIRDAKPSGCLQPLSGRTRPAERLKRARPTRLHAPLPPPAAYARPPPPCGAGSSPPLSFPIRLSKTYRIAARSTAVPIRPRSLSLKAPSPSRWLDCPSSGRDKGTACFARFFALPSFPLDPTQVENAGIEPATSCLQSRRSPN